MEPWITNPPTLLLRGFLITTIPRSLAMTTTLRTSLSQNPRMNTPLNLRVLNPHSWSPKVVHLLLPILVRSLRGRTFVNIPCGRERLRITSTKSPNILWIMGSKFPWESPGFLMTYSITGIPIEESSNMTHHGKNFLISACEKSPTLIPFLMIPIRSILKPARSLGNQYKILPPISNNERINSLNPILMANALYTSKLIFLRKSDFKQTSIQNHPGPIICIWSGLLRLNQIWMTGKEL